MVQSTNWGSATVELTELDSGGSVEFDIYLGLGGVLFESNRPVLGDDQNSSTAFIKWEEQTCNNRPVFNLTDECADCKQASLDFEVHYRHAPRQELQCATPHFKIFFSTPIVKSCSTRYGCWLLEK